MMCYPLYAYNTRAKKALKSTPLKGHTTLKMHATDTVNGLGHVFRTGYQLGYRQAGEARPALGGPKRQLPAIAE